MGGDYFTYAQSQARPLQFWVVQGRDGELRSSFPSKDMAHLHCAQLNAAFVIGQRELLKEQSEGK